MKKIVLITHHNSPQTSLIHLLSNVFPECRIEYLQIHQPPERDRKDMGIHDEGDLHEHQKTVSQDETRLQSNV